MKNILLFLVTMFVVIPAMAADDWKSYFKNDQVEILYRYTDCHDIPNGIHQQKILLRFVNYKEKPVEIFFEKELTFSNSITKPDVRDFSVHLNGGEILQGDCDVKDNRLWIFSKQLNFNSTHLKHFELKNISVKNIQ